MRRDVAHTAIDTTTFQVQLFSCQLASNAGHDAPCDVGGSDVAHNRQVTDRVGHQDWIVRGRKARFACEADIAVRAVLVSSAIELFTEVRGLWERGQGLALFGCNDEHPDSALHAQTITVDASSCEKCTAMN